MTSSWMHLRGDLRSWIWDLTLDGSIPWIDMLGLQSPAIALGTPVWPEGHTASHATRNVALVGSCEAALA